MADRRAPHPRPATESSIPAEVLPEAFEFQEPSRTTARSVRRRRTPLWQTLGLWVCGLGVLAAIGYGGWKASQRPAFERILTLQHPGDHTLEEQTSLAFRIGVAVQGVPTADLTYSLVDSPEGAVIDAATGEFFWTPSEAQGPGSYTIAVRAEAPGTSNDEIRFDVQVTEVAQPPLVPEIDELVAESDAPVSFVVEATDEDVPASPLTFSLEGDVPEGATIDAETGRFKWSPQVREPGLYPVTVRVAKADADGLHATRTIYVRIPEPAGAAWLIERVATHLRDAGNDVTIGEGEPLSGLDGDPAVITVNESKIRLVSFDSEEKLAAAAANIPADPSLLLGTEYVETLPLHLYRGDGLIALYQGDEEAILAALSASLGSPFITTAARPVKEPPPPTPEDIQTLLGLLDKKILFNTKQYPEIRKIFADRFQAEFDAEIRRAFGEDYDEITKWLDEHPDFKQELYSAINPRFDDVEGALSLFKQLKEQFPKQIESYGELAIAVAVTWDRDRGGIYEYDHHARRTSSNYGGELLDGVGNFRFLVEAEPQMQGRAQYLPWEFLVHLVNHRTPVAERAWAFKGYGGRRTMFGQCYSDVPYDDEMLRTSSQVCRLNGQDYVLPNLLQFGGVCAMQADFACRVGKSLGVPAEYVSGESIYGDRHAWVMWIELKNVTRSNIAFTLESHGRYRGDKYYVGELNDPQTGETMTDRQLELRLHNAGINPLAARQARLVMKAYPLLRDAAKMAPGDRITFLNHVIDLSPGNEDAWQALAAIPGEGTLTRDDQRLMMGSFDRLFRTFANFPDFTWTVFDGLIAFAEAPKQRISLYERLVVLYESAGRPDLACEARLKLTDLLLEEERTGEAIEGLAYTIKKFPDEGRYVPRLLDRLEAICAGIPELSTQLVRFYTEFLPAIPRTRGSDPSKYCLEMYERAIALFRANGQPQLATILSAELTKIQASQAR